MKFKLTESIYDELNKIDDEESLKQRSQINENFNEVGTYPYMYISNTGDEYQDTMSDEEINQAYELKQFSDKMWLKSEAHITSEDGSYQVSWGEFDDYRTASSVAACKKIVQKYYPYGFRWLKFDGQNVSNDEKRISTKLSKVREKITSRLREFINMNSMMRELRNFKNEDNNISPALYIGFSERIRPIDINVSKNDQRTLLPYTQERTSGKAPCIGIVMYHSKNDGTLQTYIDKLHKIFNNNVKFPEYFKYVGIGKRLGTDTLLYELCLPDNITDEINNTALDECGLELSDNSIVEIKDTFERA